jgi:cytochrome P450
LFQTWAYAVPLGTLAALFGFEGGKETLRKMHAHAIAINKALFVTGGTGPRRSPGPNAFEKARISFYLVKNVQRILQLRKLLGPRGTKELMRMLSPVKPAQPGPRPDFTHIPAAIGPMLDMMLLFARPLAQKNGNGGASLARLKQHIRSGDVTLTEMVLAGAFILFAGYETTASLLSNCFVHLARHPETFRDIKNNPGMLEPFIEESLRFYTPVGRFLRKTKTDVMVGSQVIPAHSLVIVMPGAANTDPEKFHHGCAFDPDRENNRQHLSFGKGAHFCIGAPLARMQVIMAIRELVTRAVRLELDETVPLKWVTDRDNGILRYEQVWVRAIR